MTRQKICIAVICILVLQIIAGPAYSATIPANAGNPPAVKSASGVLMDQKTGKVLFEKNMRVRHHPASLTKILTSLLILENLGSDDVITVGDEIDNLEKDSSKAGLKKGQKVTAHDLVWALMLPSGNDAAYTAAVYIARKKTGNTTMKVKEAVSFFVGMMNTRAQQIGAIDSHFTNPDGYPDPNHYSTAYDMALVSKEALENDFFKEVARTYTYIKDQNSKSKTVVLDKDTENVWFNKNLLLNPKSKYFYKYATGIKTGYTLKAGYCLAASATKDDLSLVSVILNAESEESRCMESQALFDYAFSNYQYRSILKKGNVICNANVIRKYFGDSANINLLADSDYNDLLSDEEYYSLEKSFSWDESIFLPEKSALAEINFIGPISRGQSIGKVRFSLSGKVLVESELLASGDALKGDFKDSIVKLVDRINKYKYIFIGAVLCIIAGFIVLGKMKRRV
jgi:serine-type D-Ala-D-Ala carboxypeptidase (penicillin-binding protein 5/6)